MNQNTTNNQTNNTTTDASQVKEVQLTPNNTQTVEEVSINPNKTLDELNIPGETSPVETEVINTSHKKTSNVFMFIVIVLIIIFIYKIDDIIAYFDTNFVPTVSDDVDNTSSNNLVNGFIVMNENNSFIKVEKIKFYNFKKGNNEITYNYVSDKKYKTTDSLGIYIEIYNINKELLYKKLVNLSDVENGTIRLTSMKVTNDVYQDSYYILVKTYSEEEKNAKTTLVCKYNINDDKIVLNYQVTYNFINNNLNDYTVSKEYISTEINSETTKVKNELLNENNDAIKYGISTEYSENKLTYSVDLNNLKEGFIPLYDSSTVKKTIINKESLKKWNCE